MTLTPRTFTGSRFLAGSAEHIMRPIDRKD
nr:MAG TPA: hypothetical protein [Caudoviricetes sp.]DAP48454.1 MAG TPA: hypothetical protein [Caudoviricetes sp.]